MVMAEDLDLAQSRAPKSPGPQKAQMCSTRPDPGQVVRQGQKTLLTHLGDLRWSLPKVLPNR